MMMDDSGESLNYHINPIATLKILKTYTLINVIQRNTIDTKSIHTFGGLI